jgi:NADH-quinone oxidoreductase subunit C
MLKTKIDRKNPKLQSIINLWPQAVTYEFELNEMFGVFFEGNNRMGEEFILEDWDDIPQMRRDFDTLEYANNTFKFRDERKDKKVIREFISEHYDEWRNK